MSKGKLKALLAALAIVLALSLPACSDSKSAGGAGTEVKAPAEAPGAGTEDSAADSAADGNEIITFIYKGVEIVPGAEAAALVARLGEPNDVFVAPSCAFEGEDRIYYYPGVDITTWPAEDGFERILSYSLRDDSVQTEQGLYIGMAKVDMEALIGAGASNDNGSVLSWFSGDVELRCYFENGKAADVTVFFLPAQGVVDAAN